MTLAELLLHTRKVILRDYVQPYLWADEELIRYFAEGEAKFARHTHCLVSDDNELSQLELQAGVASYPLSPDIIHVYDMHNEEGVPLRALPRSRAPHMVAEGSPRSFSTGRGSNTVRVYPTPDDAYVVTMLVAHLPIEKLSVDADQEYAEPTIPEEYHLHLSLYAAYKALLNNDPEGSNTTAAADFYAQWMEALREAKRDGFSLRTPSNARVVTNWTGARRV